MTVKRWKGPELYHSQADWVAASNYDELASEVAWLRRDAERYRWLCTATMRDGKPYVFLNGRPISGAALDEAIDEAIAADRENERE